MLERYYFGAYWSPRQESAEACARRAGRFFQNLALVDPLFARWFKPARSRKEALNRPLEMDLAHLEDFFQRKVLRDDTGLAMEDMGFNLALWNGGNGDEDVGLTLTCGASWENATNLCLLEPPSSGPHRERVLTVPVLVGVLRSMALVWEPDWGVIMSRAHERDLPRQPASNAQIGWVTYLSRQRGTLPPLPAPVRVEPVEDKGSLLILTPERFTASNPEHLALATHVRELLERAGLLHPLKPDASR
jgi:hypothetical protein